MVETIDSIEFATRKQKEQLHHLYCVKKSSIRTIANLFDQTSEWVEEKLVQHDIPLRKKSLEPRRGNGRNETYGYIRIKVNGAWVLEHRYVWEQIHGPLPKGWVVHHINGNKSDNRPTNLLGLPKGEHSPEATGLIRVRISRIVELEDKVAQLEGLIEAYEELICSPSL